MTTNENAAVTAMLTATTSTGRLVAATDLVFARRDWKVNGRAATPGTIHTSIIDLTANQARVDWMELYSAVQDRLRSE